MQGETRQWRLCLSHGALGLGGGRGHRLQRPQRSSERELQLPRSIASFLLARHIGPGLPARIDFSEKGGNLDFNMKFSSF